MRTTAASIIFPCLILSVTAVNAQQGSVGDLPPLPDLPEPNIERVPVLPVEPTPPQKAELPKAPSGYKVISSSEAFSLVPDEEKSAHPEETQPEKSSWNSSEKPVETTAPTQQQWSGPHSWSSTNTTNSQPTYSPVSSKNPIGHYQTSKNPISVTTSKISSGDRNLAFAKPSVESPATGSPEKNRKKFKLGKLLRYKKASSYRYRGRLGSTTSIRFPNAKAKQN